MKTDFVHNALSTFTKDELFDIASFMGAGLAYSLRKDDMLSALAGFIVDGPEKWLSNQMGSDLDLLRDLVKAGPGKFREISWPDFPSMMEVMNLLKVRRDSDRPVQVAITRELYDIVSPHIDKALSDYRSSGRREMEQMVLGYLNLYGIIPQVDFLMLCSGSYSPYELVDCPVMKVCRVRDDITGEIYLISPNVVDADKLLETRRKYNLPPVYRRFSVSEAMDAGAGYGSGSYKPWGKYGKRLRVMLEDLGYEGEELERELHLIWVNSQVVDDDAMDELFYSVSECTDEFDTFGEYRDCMQVIADYANHSPKWLLNGYTALQKNRLVIELKDDEGEEEELRQEESEAAPFGNFGMVSPHLALPGKIVVPHVGLDDPCPCGSGLKFRNCHGRHFS